MQKRSAESPKPRSRFIWPTSSAEVIFRMALRTRKEGGPWRRGLCVRGVYPRRITRPAPTATRGWEIGALDLLVVHCIRWGLCFYYIISARLGLIRPILSNLRCLAPKLVLVGAVVQLPPFHPYLGDKATDCTTFVCCYSLRQRQVIVWVIFFIHMRG